MAQDTGAMKDRVSAILDRVEDGRLSAEQAIRFLAARPAPATLRGIRCIRLEIGRDERPFRLTLPFLPAAVVLMVAELVLYPLVLLVLWIVRSRSHDRELAPVLANLPVLPLTRTLAALIQSRAPLQIGVQDDGAGFSLSVG